MRSRDVVTGLGALSALGLIGSIVVLGLGAAPGHTAAAGGDAPAEALSQAPVERAHFHHVHLNVTDRDSTIAFYEKFFGAVPLEYRNRQPALFTERSFILLNEVDEKPEGNLETSFAHFGWSGVDGPSEYRWRSEEGIDVQTPATPLGSNFYMYFYGPDGELVEVYTGNRNHRFEHLHVHSTDVDETLAWFERHLGLPAGPTGQWTGGAMRTKSTGVDNVNLIAFEVPTSEENWPAVFPEGITGPFEPTDGRAMDHIAFSYSDIEPVERRMRDAGVTVVRPVAERPEGHRSFFVRGPDNLLVEIVEAELVPQGLWSE